MEVYTPALELLGVLEEYQSVIWEEKAFGAGSFSVDALLTDKTRELLTEENILWIGGDTAGTIEHYDKTAEDGAYITVKGRLLTGILDKRILWGLYDLSGTPPEIMHYLVNECCIDPTRGDIEARKIPGLVLLDAPTRGEKIYFQKTGGSLLEVLEAIGAAYQVAFGVRFNPAVPRMEFWTRWGVNRGINQNANEQVFYSTQLDDVLSSEYSYDSINWRNVALVAGEGEGKDRKMVVVEQDVPDTPTPPAPPVTEKYKISLSVDPDGGGTASGGGTFENGKSITVTAAPSDKFEFVEWRENGGAVSTSAAYTFTVNRDRNLTAVFAALIPVYVVTVAVDPPGGGTVTGGGAYEQGKSVTLTQTVAEGYRFTGWYNAAGEQLGTGETYTFTPTENVTITAKYAVIPVYTISVTIDPAGYGTVAGAGKYKEGETVTLKATADDGYTFTEWRENGSVVHSGEEYSFTASRDVSLTAVFAVKPSSRLPEGYTELEYIQSSGKQYINTGIVPTSTTKIELDIEPTADASSSSKFFFYSYYFPASGAKFVFYMYWGSSGVSGAMGSYSTITATTINSSKTLRRMVLQMDATNKTASADGSSKTFSSNSFSTLMSKISLLGSGSGTSSALPAKLYSCKIQQGGSLARDFVPCIDPSGIIGLYDVISDSFYENAGSDTFTPGPAV